MRRPRASSAWQPGGLRDHLVIADGYDRVSAADRVAEEHGPRQVALADLIGTGSPSPEPSAATVGGALDSHRAREEFWASRFDDAAFEGRRLFSEVLGTFMLVLAGAGGGVVDAVSHGKIGRVAAVTAPGLTVLAVILFMGAVSGAHLNPAVSVAFAARGAFPWRRVPGYMVAQLLGAILAVLFLLAVFGRVGMLGATVPGAGVDDAQAALIELALTAGLVSTILGTASSAQNLGPISAFGVAGYIILAGLWSSPISGASMNPARSVAPAVILGDLSHLWVYVVGPLAGALVAVVLARILRGPGGHDPRAQQAAQGSSSSS